MAYLPALPLAACTPGELEEAAEAMREEQDCAIIWKIFRPIMMRLKYAAAQLRVIPKPPFRFATGRWWIEVI